MKLSAGMRLELSIGEGLATVSNCEMHGGSHEVGGPFQGKMADSSRFRVNFARFL